MDRLTLEWNSHYIRGQTRNDTVPGIPDILFHAPTISGYENQGNELINERVENLLAQRDIISEGREIMNTMDVELEDYFNYVIETENLPYPPANWQDAKQMYLTIINAF